MVNKQPEALRLADALGDAPKWQQLQAAAELRRLYEENQKLQEMLKGETVLVSIWQQRTANADAVQQELLTACKAFLAYNAISDGAGMDDYVSMMVAYNKALHLIADAVAKAEGASND